MTTPLIKDIPDGVEMSDLTQTRNTDSPRNCTCHPDDRKWPCQHRHATSECKTAWLETEIERLRELKTPASRELLNITKALLDDANAENVRLRTALQRLVMDYQDVPDPTDTDGQAVFEDARRTLEGGK